MAPAAGMQQLAGADPMAIESALLDCEGGSPCDRPGPPAGAWRNVPKRSLLLCLTALLAVAWLIAAPRPGRGTHLSHGGSGLQQTSADLSGSPLSEQLDAGNPLPRSCTRGAAAPRRDPSFTLAGKSIYFMMTDRFARSDSNSSRCTGDSWCGGTLRGITSHLDYIQGMGFDCIWITPVVKQFEGKDPSNNVTGYHGYWAYDFFRIDPHFGTEQDLKDLSAALHERGMCLVYDMVMRHVGPVVSSADVAKIRPFNETRYFNQLEPASSFDEYTRCWRELKPKDSSVDCPTPVQALGSQAFAPNHTTPSDLPFCGIGNYNCAGYNDTITHSGWFYNLGDLNQSVPFVRENLICWAVHMVETYHIDAIRLDTAPFVPSDFLAELQKAVGVEILGEVTTTNQTFHASYQLEAAPATDGVAAGSQVLAGVLNFPLATVAPTGFCGPKRLHGGRGYPFANLNLTRLGSAMKEQLTSGRYANPDLLGNFVDNHDDPPRIGYACLGDESRITNALAWVMFSRGVPIIYYGTEQGMHGENDFRDSLWQFGYDTQTRLYKFFAEMNRVRKLFNMGATDAEVVVYNERHLVFTRGGKFGAWVYLNNLEKSNDEVTYPGAAPPPPPDGKMWADALAVWWSGAPQAAQLPAGGDFIARGTMPKVLVLVDAPAGHPAAEPSAILKL